MRALFLASTLFLTGADAASNELALGLGPRAEYLFDQGEFESVRKVPGWTAVDSESPSFGFDRRPLWIQFKLNNPSASRRLVLDLGYPLHDLVEYRQIVSGKVAIKKIAGDWLPFTRREIESPSLAFYLDAPRGLSEYYLRVQSEGSLALPLRLVAEAEFKAENQTHYRIIFLYFGVLLVMAIYNLFIFFSLRDRAYLLYSAFTICLLFNTAALNGMAFQFLWPDFPVWGNQATLVAIYAIHALGIQFSRVYLNTAAIAPRIDRALKYLALLCALGLGLVFILPYWTLIRPVAALAFGATSLLVAAAVIGVRMKSRPAYFYSLAWLALLAGNFAVLAKNLGLLPATPFLQYSIQIGSVFETVLLALGLADRINALNIKLADLNATLEQKVVERTEQLLATNVALQRKNYVVQKELQIAWEIQRHFLPAFALQGNGLAIQGHYRPLEKVGGDYYDVFYRDGWTGIVLADAVGHGVPGALLTALAKISFSDAVGRSQSPADILADVNESMLRLVKAHGHLTAFFAAISPDMELSYANAAHPPGYIVRKDARTIVALEADGFFLGLGKPDQRYELKRERLERGDRLFLFSDGIYDHHLSDQSVITDEWMADALRSTAAEDLSTACAKFLARWEAVSPAVDDDMTFLLIEGDPTYQPLVA